MNDSDERGGYVMKACRWCKRRFKPERPEELLCSDRCRRTSKIYSDGKRYLRRKDAAALAKSLAE